MKNVFKIIDKHLLISFSAFRIKFKIPTPAPKIAKINEFSLNQKERNPKIIASLTSFPQRINIVEDVVKSIMNQTLKPDKICLWLAEEQFKNKENDIPSSLLQLKKYGLEINWCSDLRSYKKIIPALQKYPDDIIVTFDDDIYYAKDTIEELYSAYKKNPQAIQAHRASRIKLVQDKIKAYRFYEQIDMDCSAPSYFNRLTGCGSVLYPPKCLNKEVCGEEKFKKLIPTHDDVWLWAMAVLNRTKTSVVKGYKESIYTIEKTQKFGLCKHNNSKTGTSVLQAYEIILKAYPQILDILKEEKCG